jgi:hypothetical protein
MRMNPYISCCGRYDCTHCDYHRGVIVEAAKALLEHFEKPGSLRLIAEHKGAYDYDGFFKASNGSLLGTSRARVAGSVEGGRGHPTASSGTA